MNKVKVYYYQIIFIFLIFNHSILSAQVLQNDNLQKIEVLNILNGYEDSWCGLSDKNPMNNIISLVNLGSNYSNTMASIGLEKGNEHFLFRIITTLGFIAKDNDVHVIKLLEKYAYTKNSFQEVAIDAIFRIGGNLINKNIDYIVQLDNEDISYQIELLEEIWLINTLSDLIEIKKALNSIVKDYPNKKITNYIKITLVNRVIHAINILESPTNSESTVLMEGIFQFKLDNSFLFVNKWVSLIWALEKLISIDNDVQKSFATIKSIQETMKIKNYSDPGHLTEYIIYCKYKLGRNPSVQEIDWMNQNSMSPLNFTFEIFQNSEQLLDYHNFREQFLR